MKDIHIYIYTHIHAICETIYVNKISACIICAENMSSVLQMVREVYIKGCSFTLKTSYLPKFRFTSLTKPEWCEGVFRWLFEEVAWSGVSKQLSIMSSLWYITLAILFWHPIGISPFEVLTTNRTACPSRPAARCLSNKSTTSLDGDVEASTARITTPRLTCCSSPLFTTNWVVVNNAKPLWIYQSEPVASLKVFLFTGATFVLNVWNNLKELWKRIEANGTMEWGWRATWTKGQSGIRIYDLCVCCTI